MDKRQLSLSLSSAICSQFINFGRPLRGSWSLFTTSADT